MNIMAGMFATTFALHTNKSLHFTMRREADQVKGFLLVLLLALALGILSFIIGVGNCALPALAHVTSFHY